MGHPPFHTHEDFNRRRMIAPRHQRVIHRVADQSCAAPSANRLIGERAAPSLLAVRVFISLNQPAATELFSTI
jgi:hypothetical protein